MKKTTLLFAASLILFSCKGNQDETIRETSEVTIENNEEDVEFPENIVIDGVAQNPEGIEYNKNDHTFLLSSLNAGPIIKVNLDGTYAPFTSGEPYPMSTAGLQIDYENNRLLVAGFNGMELYDQDPNTKGMSNLRIYNLETGVMESDINLSNLVPDATAYFANDVAVDTEGNAYISDWYAGVVYKVDLEGNASIFWSNETEIPSGVNGLDFHSDGYLLISLVSVNEKGLYADYGLVKIPVSDPKLATVVTTSDTAFTGFDGMVINENGNIIGVTNNGNSPGGNTLIELSSDDNWKTAKVVHTKEITPSTTVAVTETNENYVINQDFSMPMKENWTIEKIKF